MSSGSTISVGGAGCQVRARNCWMQARRACETDIVLDFDERHPKSTRGHLDRLPIGGTTINCTAGGFEALTLRELTRRCHGQLERPDTSLVVVERQSAPSINAGIELLASFTACCWPHLNTESKGHARRSEPKAPPGGDIIHRALRNQIDNPYPKPPFHLPLFTVPTIQNNP